MSDTVTPPASVPVVIQSPAKGDKTELVDAIREAVKPSKKERRAAIEAKAVERGQNDLLKGMGVKKSERARLIEKVKAGEFQLSQLNQTAAESEKANKELSARAEKAEAELKLLQDRSTKYEALAKASLDEQFSALDEKAQKLIAKLAGDNLEKRMELINDLRESGYITKQEAAAVSAQVKDAVKPTNPANTSKAVNPKAPSPAGELTPRQQWQQMRTPREGESQLEQVARDRLAAQFYAQNQNAIDRDWP